MKKQEIDPEKLFNTKEYNTIIIDANGKVADDSAVAKLVKLLSDKDTRVEALKTLKEENCDQLLVDCISVAEDQNHKQLLTAAAWESDLNFNKHLVFFVSLATTEDYLVCLEAITVIEENMTGKIDNAIVDEALQIIEKSFRTANNTEKSVLLEGLANTIENFKTEVTA